MISIIIILTASYIGDDVRIVYSLANTMRSFSVTDERTNKGILGVGYTFATHSNVGLWKGAFCWNCPLNINVRLLLSCQKKCIYLQVCTGNYSRWVTLKWLDMTKKTVISEMSKNVKTCLTCTQLNTQLQCTFLVFAEKQCWKISQNSWSSLGNLTPWYHDSVWLKVSFRWFKT